MLSLKGLIKRDLIKKFTLHELSRGRVPKCSVVANPGNKEEMEGKE